MFARAKPSFAGTKLWFAGSILSFAAAKRKRRHTLRRIFRLLGLPFSAGGARWMVVGIVQVVLHCRPLVILSCRCAKRPIDGARVDDKNQERLVYFKPRFLFLVKKERQGRPERNNLIIFAHQEQKKAISSAYRQ